MKRKSCTVVRSRQVESVPTLRHLPLVDLLVDTRTELLELAVRSGMKVLEAMMEEDRTAVCGARYPRTRRPYGSAHPHTIRPSQSITSVLHGHVH